MPSLIPGELVLKTTAEHRCCLLPRIGRQIRPVIHLNNEQQENEQRQKVEAYVFSKLEEYSRQKSLKRFHLTSFSHIRRRLKRDIKDFSRQFEPYSVSEEKILQWLDETLERINSHFPQLRSLVDSQNELKQLFLSDDLSSSNNINNQWQQLQIKRARDLFSDSTTNENELLLNYQKYILQSLTPNKLEDDRLPLKTNETIHLDLEYNKAETTGREYLKQIFDDYKTRQYPNLNLLKEMIHLGMEQMIKRPKTDELRKASTSSNILHKISFILKSKNAYSMSLKNIADDFMVNFYFEFLFRKKFSLIFLVFTFWSFIRESK